MPGKKCFLMGHRNAPEGLRPLLAAEIERHITACHVGEFIVGAHGRFDKMAAQELAAAQKHHPHVALTLLLAYYPGQGLPPSFDGSLFPPGLENAPKRFAIAKANRYALGLCDYLLAYAWQPGSNTLKLVETARAGRQHKIAITLLPRVDT